MSEDNNKDLRINVEGYGGSIQVKVEFNGDEIENVNVISHSETPGIGDTAIPIILDRIKAEKTYDVDAVSGATITSSVIKKAVKGAIEASGRNLDAYKKTVPNNSEKETQELYTGVIVVGAGIGGYSAAVASAEAGVDTILVEKLDIIGGTAIIAGGAFMATNSYLNDEHGDESEELADWWYDCQERHHNVSYDQLLFVARNSGKYMNWIREKSGVDFQLGYGGNSPKKWSHRPVFIDGEINNNHGTPRIIMGLNAKFREYGGHLMTSTKAEELIVGSEGEVIGIVAESRKKKYCIYAKYGVVMATGGYENNKNLVARFAPACLHMKNNGKTAGDDGDGIIMCEKVGAKLAYSGYLMGSWNHMQNAGRYGIEPIFFKHKVKCIEVNAYMERFYNENTNPVTEKNAFADDGTKEYYVIFDSSLDEDILKKFDNAVAGRVMWKDDDIGNLALQVNKSELALKSTINHWNEMAEKGEDSDFGNPLIAPLDKPPFYMARVLEMSTGSFGGVAINTNAEVLDTDGKPIKGLYATGELANGNFYYRHYVCGGSSFIMSGVFGVTAANRAINRFINE